MKEVDTPILPQTLVIATHNRHKAREMIQILQARFPDIRCRTLADYPGAPQPEETGSTYAENAAIKAASAAAFTGEMCVADDAGLEIDALNGAPGVHSHRFEGVDTPFPQKMARILERMDGVPTAQRGARFRCSVVLEVPGQKPIHFESICEGKIADAPHGSGGFGYDPIFFLPERSCTMADLTPEQKHSVSHRGKVLSKLGDFLEKFFAAKASKLRR